MRYYRFAENSNEKDNLKKQIDLDHQKTILFPQDYLHSVPEESISKTYAEALSQVTNKPISSLKSTSQVRNKVQNDRSVYDLKMNCKGAHSNKPQTKSLLENNSKQKSSMLLSHKHKSSIKEEDSRLYSKPENWSNSIKSQKSAQSQKSSILRSMNNEEED